MGLRDLFRKGDDALDPGDADGAVLERLRAHGADLAKPREVLHYLYVRTRDDAERVAPEVREAGYEVEVREPLPEYVDSPHPWLVLATTHAVVDETSVAAARALFERLAAEHGGDYDGWEAAAD